jgi:hypothetical protein
MAWVAVAENCNIMKFNVVTATSFCLNYISYILTINCKVNKKHEKINYFIYIIQLPVTRVIWPAAALSLMKRKGLCESAWRYLHPPTPTPPEAQFSFERMSFVLDLGIRSYCERICTRTVKRDNVCQLLVNANVVPISLIVVTLMMEAIFSSETLVLTRVMRCHIPEDGIIRGTNKQTPWPLVRKRTVLTERPTLVDEI